MPHKPKPAPVFVARTTAWNKTNFGMTEDETIYVIEMRRGFCAGNEKPAVERTRKLGIQHGRTAMKMRAVLRQDVIDSKQPKA